MKLFQSVFLAALVPAIAFSQSPIQNERFGTVDVRRGAAAEGPAVILFTGSPGDTDTTRAALEPVTSLIVSVDTKRYKEGIERQEAGKDCAYLAGEVERLGQSIQNSQSLSYYRLPWLVGVGEGASLAYAVYAEHPRSFSGIVTWGGCSEVPLGVALCKGEYIEPGFDPAGRRVTYPFRKNLPGRNYFLGWQERGCSVMERLPQPEAWAAHLKELFESEADTAPPAEVAGLPLIEIPSGKKPESSALVVFLSGDGGWATIDKEIGRYLADSGVPVVGFDALRYFWSRKTPEETAHAVMRVIAKYRKLWHKDKVVLIGFSLGAEHVPYILNRMPEVSRPVVPLAVLLSPAKATDFEVHISDWLGLEPTNGEYQVGPEIRKVTHTKLACVYGSDEESDSACVDLPSEFAEVRKLPGGHHFNGDYAQVGELILGWIRGEGL